MIRFLRQVLGVWIALCAALATAPARAQSYMSDIDVYGEGGGGGAANVLIVIDNTANWSTPFTNEMTAIVNTLNNLQVTTSIRVGLMLFTETGGGNNGANSGPDGGYVRAAIRPFSSDYKTKLVALVNSFDSNRDQGNGGKSGLSLAEAYRYYRGGPAYAGNNKAKADWGGTRTEPNATTYAASYNIYNLGSNALSSKTATNYTGPSTADTCGNNYIIYISNGPQNDNTTVSNDSRTILSGEYSRLSLTDQSSSTIALTPNGMQTNMMDEWARFMKHSAPENVTSYVVEVDPGSQPTDRAWTALMQSVATQGGGGYASVTSGSGGSNITIALSNVFNQILAANSVFSSASLPVSVNARGSYLNQVYMGMFRPDGDGKPRWRGNLKQYKFAYNPSTDSVYLVDSLNVTAISGTTGFVSPTAVSYWTTPSTMFTNEASLTSTASTTVSISDSPDGNQVERGGAAQRLREDYKTDQSGRKVYTCIGTCNPQSNSSSTDLSASTTYTVSTSNTSNVTTSLLGAASNTERDQIINWARGTFNTTASIYDSPYDTSASPAASVRPSIHGDVLHSRPAVVNYGPTGTNNVVVFYGANDGMLHAINGNQAATYNSVEAGGEFWSYLPQEHLSKLKRLRDNSPEIRLYTTSSVTSQTPRDFAMDGPVGVYQKVSSDGTSSKVYVYAAMRRGGQALYAFDVTNISAPKLMWKKQGTTSSESTSYLSKLGQTWSEPKVARLKGVKDGSGNDLPVIIMGGGYDATAEDAFTPGSVSTGNRIYILNAFTGELLKEFTTTRSVPSDVAVVDSDYDGYVDRAYVADVGGNVYRIDFEVAEGNTCPTSGGTCYWKMNQIAALSSDSVTRKVFFPPDVVLSSGFTGVLVGTGDREKPLCGRGSPLISQCTSTGDGFYTLKDYVGSKPPSNQSYTVIQGSSLETVGTTGASFTNGCVLPLSTAGEKVINAPLTVGGYTYFSTNTPSAAANSCSGSLGTAKTYGAKVFCQGAIAETRTGGGLPPSPVSGVVSVSYTDPTTNQSTTKQVPFVIGGIADPTTSTGTTGNPANDSGCGLAGCKPVLNISPTRTRKYWFIENTR